MTDDLPRRQPLTDKGARDTPLSVLLDRVDRFTGRHPYITITPPYNTLNKRLWEVRVSDSLAQWDDAHLMMTSLEERYDR